MPQLRAAALPPCPAGANGITTLPDWVTGALPAGTTLARGSTGVNAPQDDGAPRPLVTLLVGRKDGEQVPTITLYRTPGVTAATLDPSQEWNPGVPRLTTVRGRPGTVGQTISRSGPGPTTATWGEAGDTWTATSTLGVDALAAALGALRLADDGVTDPTGAFTQVGSGPYLASGAWSRGLLRVTQLEVRTAAPTPAKQRVLYVRIDPAAPGTTGPLGGPAGGTSSTTELDGRTVLLNPYALTAALDDGSQVGIRAYDGQSQPASLDPATATAVLAGLHRRGPADAPLVDSLPVGDAGPDGAVPPGFCREA